jgi:hypothetical protein
MADLTQFDLDSAARIARVVRSVEQTPQPGTPLSFAPLMDVRGRGGKVFRVATHTADWNKNTQQTVTFFNQTATPNTVVASNLLFNLAGPGTSGASTTKVCVIGKEGDDWYLVNTEKYQCAGGSYSGKELSPGTANDQKLQVLVNDQGCVRWMNLEKQFLISGLVFTEEQGFSWAEAEYLVIFSDAPGVEFAVEVADCPAPESSP